MGVDVTRVRFQILRVSHLLANNSFLNQTVEA